MRYLAILLLVLIGSPTFYSSAQTVVPPAQNAQTSAVPAAPQPGAELTTAEALIAKSDWKGAETKLAAWLTTHPEDGRALFDAGYVADAQNKTEDARAFYSRAVKADPKSFEAHLSLGLLLAREGKLDEARPELAVATTLDPGDAGTALKARAWRALAQIDRRNDPAAASNDLLEALKLSPETPRDTLLAAELAEQTAQWEPAEKAYRRVLAEQPDSSEAVTGLAHVLIVEKKYSEAEALLQPAVQKSPNDPTLNAQLATALAAQSKPEALPLLQKLHQAHPQDANITRMLADMLQQSGDAAGSDKLYAALLTAQPSDDELWVAHGQNLIQQLRFKEAFDAFNKAAEIDPSNPDAWSGLAFAASKTDQPSVTLHALTMRSKYLSESASTYFLWATSYDMLHDRKAAITYYHHFLEAAAGKFPDQEWQARQRLLLLEKKP